MKNQAGVTMVELIMALTLSLAVLGIASTLLIIFFRNYTFSFTEQQSVIVVQQTVTAMVREIRETRQAANGAWPILEAGDNSLSFYSDITNDHQSDLVRYFLDGTDLKKSVIEPSGSPPAYVLVNERTETVAANVDLAGQPLFTYYNGDWPADTSSNPLTGTERVSNTSFIRLYVRVVLDPDDPTNVYTGETGVQLKNLKRN